MIIAFAGAKRHGKGVSAQFASELLLPETSTQVGFADKLKLAAARALGFTGDLEECIALMDEAKECWDIVLADNGREFKTLSGRKYLQRFGTEVGRDVFGKDFWVDQVLPKPTNYGSVDNGWHGWRRTMARYPGIDHLLIPDCRFPNEAQRVKALGGKVVEVIRPQLFERGEDTHVSETPLPRELVDVTIINDGDLDLLRDRVDEALQGFGLL